MGNQFIRLSSLTSFWEEDDPLSLGPENNCPEKNNQLTNALNPMKRALKRFDRGDTCHGSIVPTMIKLTLIHPPLFLLDLLNSIHSLNLHYIY